MSTEPLATEQLKFWDDNCWSQGRAPWHRVTPHQDLLIHHEKIINKTAADTTVLVPLCGKTVDLIWLWQKGHTVVGVEGVETAIKVFQEENKLQLKESTNEDGLKTHSTEDGKLIIIEGDFLDENQFASWTHKFDAVWDRASLVAIGPEHHHLYMATVKRLLKPDCFRYLLSTFEFNCESFVPPPHSVPHETVKKLFSELGTIEQLSRTQIPDFLAKRLAELGAEGFEGVYLISK